MLEPSQRQHTRKPSARSPLGAPTEETIHRAIVSHLAHRAAPGTVWWHVPNGEARHAAIGGKLRALGTRSGMPDLMFLRAGTLYALEVKREGGKVSLAQPAMLAELQAAGGVVAVAYGLNQAVGKLAEWGMLR